MPRIQGFPPIANRDARVLILGSMPGKASLQANQYYAHPRNGFWPILCELLGVQPDATNAARIRALKSAGIALWDVLHSCNRDGSLDARINSRQLVINDFQNFFHTHPRINHVFFNGAAAETLFRRRVLSALDHYPENMTRLPSTSPAHAAMSLKEKRQAWCAMLNIKDKALPIRGSSRYPVSVRRCLVQGR